MQIAIMVSMFVGQCVWFAGMHYNRWYGAVLAIIGALLMYFPLFLYFNRVTGWN